MMQIITCDQGSPEWLAARAGIPTSSMFKTVMAVGPKGGKSATRVDYLNKLVGEIITGEPMDNFVSADMERGKLMEDEARDLYAFQTTGSIQRVGFVRSGDKGASPDSLIDDNGGLEIKSAAAHIQIERILNGELPSEHKAQVQGNLWVCEREWWDFCSYSPKLPLFIVRVVRDEDYIKSLANHVDLFNVELKQTVEYIRRYGSKAEAA
jgi:hypothetical protein